MGFRDRGLLIIHGALRVRALQLDTQQVPGHDGVDAEKRNVWRRSQRRNDGPDGEPEPAETTGDGWRESCGRD